jgi:hypothetical protein
MEVICRWLSMFRAYLIGAEIMFGLIVLVAGSALSAVEHKYDGVYTGTRSLTKGAATAVCPAEDDVSANIDGEMLTFTNSTVKNYAMPFYPRPNGEFGETHVDESGAEVHYHGRITGDVIEGDEESRDCDYHRSLKKQQ